MFLEFGKSNTLPKLSTISENRGRSAEVCDERRYGLSGREYMMMQILDWLRMTARRPWRTDTSISQFSGYRLSGREAGGCRVSMRGSNVPGESGCC
jgi:hypothetical protein